MRLPPHRSRTREASFILGAASVIAGITALASLRSANYRHTQEIVALVADRLDTPEKRGSDHHAATAELTDNDGWGRPVQVEYRADGSGEHLIVTSAGRDGQFGSADDIIERRWLPKPRNAESGALAANVHEPKRDIPHSLKHALKKSAEATLEGDQGARSGGD